MGHHDSEIMAWREHRGDAGVVGIVAAKDEEPDASIVCARNAGLFLDGLLGDERRKTGWMRAVAAGDPGPWRQQALLGRDRWDADTLGLRQAD